MSDRKTVLVVEDERTLVNAITKKLEVLGLDSVNARSVSEALDALKNNKIDAVWLDHYLLGSKSGLDFIAEVKNKQKYSSLPFFVVSNTASDDKVKSYLNLGAEKYYVKSNYRLDDIINDIKREIGA